MVRLVSLELRNEAQERRFETNVKNEFNDTDSVETDNVITKTLKIQIPSKDNSLPHRSEDDNDPANHADTCIYLNSFNNRHLWMRKKISHE